MNWLTKLKPNKEQSLSLLRNVISIACGVLVMRGIITVEQGAALVSDLSVIIPAAIGIGTTIWGILAHTDPAKVQAAVAVPGVATVVLKDDANGTLAALSKVNPNVVTETQNQKDAIQGAGIAPVIGPDPPPKVMGGAPP